MIHSLHGLRRFTNRPPQPQEWNGSGEKNGGGIGGMGRTEFGRGGDCTADG